MLVLIAGFAVGLWYGRLPAPAPQAAKQTAPAVSIVGQVTAKTSSSVTLKLQNGTTQTLPVASSTEVYSGRTQVAFSAVAVGAQVAVIPGSASAVEMINIIPPPPAPGSAPSTPK